tara:strand:+ start:996 stop:1853 length:858 start_codon:yes stop_codon:yes gene_type:complete
MEESVMASVRMSGELRDKIFKNFERQLYKIYENNSGLQDYLKSVLESFYSVEERQLMQDYLEVHERLFRMKYPKKNHEKFSSKKYFGMTYGSTATDFNWVRKVHFIINPNRPATESLTFMVGDDWHESYTNSYNDKIAPASSNYVDGDYCLTLKLEEPIQLVQQHDSSQIWAAENRVTSFKNPIIISSDVDVDNIEKFAEGTIKINESKTQIKHLLDSCTTLKRFLDTWPAGKDSVPQEYLDKMFETTKPATPSNLPKFDPNAILPDEVKEQMNSAVLTSKLMEN